MKCRKITPIVEAHQWFKNGDHPKDYDHEKVGYENGELRAWTGAEAKALGWEGQIVRYFRRPDIDGQSVCPRCGRIMHDHGFIDEGSTGYTVCVGYWILERGPMDFVPYSDKYFKENYEQVPE